VTGNEEADPVKDDAGGQEGPGPLPEEAAGALREAQIEETTIVDP
jgi:hypothetical protein